MKNETMYFNDLLSIWLEKQKQARALSTYVKYRHLADRYISPYFRSIQLSKVDLPLLQTFRNSLLSPDSLHPLGNGTIRCILLLVNSILRISYETGQTNGILYLPPRLPKKRPEVPVFTLQEQEQLEHYLTAHTGVSEAVIYLGLYTGLRVGELCALRWENIHFSDRYLHVRHTVQRLTRLDTTHKSELILSGPKSISSNRLVPLPAFLLPILQPYSHPEHPDYFLLSQSASSPMDPRTFQNHYQRILSQAGLRYLNFHAIRHTFATRCITNGMDPKTLSEILGHSDLKVTLEYYFHSSLEFKKEQIDRLTALSPAVHTSLPDMPHNMTD